MEENKTNSENSTKQFIYCPECGTSNEESTRYCTQCGTPLKEGLAPVYYRRLARSTEKSEKDETLEKGEETRNWVLLIGILIIISGFISLLDNIYGYGWISWDRLWALIPIIFGLFIIWNGLKARSRSPRP